MHALGSNGRKKELGLPGWVSHARPDLSCTHYFQAHATQATSYSTFGAVPLECSELGVFQLFLNQSQPRVSNNFNRGHSTARNFSLYFLFKQGTD